MDVGDDAADGGAVSLGRAVIAAAPSAAAYDPAVLSLTGWWRADGASGYDDSSGVWYGVASAGSSSGRNLTEATNFPSAGTAVNGHTPPDFDGSNDVLANATAISTMLTASAWFGWWLVNIDAIATSSGTSYSNDVIMNDSGAYWGIHLSSASGGLVYAYQWDGAEKAVSAAIGTGAWTLICARYDGTNLRLKVDSGTVQTVAAGNISTTTGTIQCGYNVATAYNGRMADIGLMASAGSDALFDDIKEYVNDRYSLSL